MISIKDWTEQDLDFCNDAMSQQQRYAKTPGRITDGDHLK